MSKRRVVGMAPYPVTLSNGASIAPGEIREIEFDSYAESCVEAGKLGVAPIENTPAPVATKPRKTETTPTTPQETE